jgi:hypothetical protein
MSGVFTKDIWCLLFNSYFDNDIVLTMWNVSKQIRRFLTPDQSRLAEVTSTAKNAYVMFQRLYTPMIPMSRDDHSFVLDKLVSVFLEEPGRPFGQYSRLPLTICKYCRANAPIFVIAKHHSVCTSRCFVKLDCEHTSLPGRQACPKHLTLDRFRRLKSRDPRRDPRRDSGTRF